MATAAQAALDMLFDECLKDPDCREAFPHLKDEFETVFDRLKNNPVKVTVTHPVTGERVAVQFTQEAFAESIRLMLYDLETNRQIPYSIHQAFNGEYEKFVQVSIDNNRSIRNLISFGLLLCVTCAEDVARIESNEIAALTAGTFLGDSRVRRQKAVCDYWPQSELPYDIAESVKIDVPTLILSGTLDPVTPSLMGDKVARNFSRKLHVVVPGTHGVSGTCVEKIIEQFLDTGSTERIDTSCVAEMKTPPFKIR